MNWQNFIWLLAAILIVIIFIWYFLLPHLVLLGWTLLGLLILVFLVWLFYRIFIRVRI